MNIDTTSLEDKTKDAGTSIRKKKLYKVLIVVMIIMITAVVYSFWYYYRVSNPANVFKPKVQPVEDPEPEWDIGDYFSRNIVNVALLGFDGGGERENDNAIHRPDSIKVLAIDLDAKKVNIIDIPRDMYVKIGDTSTYDKINHSYYHGYKSDKSDDPHADGISMTLKSISNFLGGIPLDYHLIVDMTAVITMVDTIGGVYFDVPYDVTDKAGVLQLKKGGQVLNGEKYLHYLRNREVGGDIGRAQRQTELLLATFKHLRSKGLFKNLPTLYKTYQDLFDTNLSNQQVISLAMFAQDLGTAGIFSHTITGSGGSKDGIYYMAVNQAVRAEIIAAVFGINVSAMQFPPLLDTKPANPKAFAARWADNGIELSWTSGGSSNSAYRLYRSEGVGAKHLIFDGLTATVYFDANINAGNTYTYELFAVNHRELSAGVAISVNVPGSVQPHPVDP